MRALTSLSINHAHRITTTRRTSLIEEAQAVAEATDDQFSMAVATVQRGPSVRRPRAVRGVDPRTSTPPSRSSTTSARGGSWRTPLAERGISNRELGRLDEAEEDLRQAVRISEELGERQLAGWTWRALARVAEKRGDQAEAEARFRRAAEEDVRRPK